MSLLKHNCAECGHDLEFPERLERVRCPRCRQHFLVEVFEDVVSLRRLKVIEAEYEPLTVDPSSEPLSGYALKEDLAQLEREIAQLNRELRQRRSSASSSLSVAFLFFFFTLAGFLIDRQLMAICCGAVTAALIVVAGSTLRDSARARNLLTIMISRREQLLRALSANIPKIF